MQNLVNVLREPLNLCPFTPKNVTFYLCFLGSPAQTVRKKINGSQLFFLSNKNQNVFCPLF